MARDDKHNSRNPSIRGGSRKHEMDEKKRLHQLSGGRPNRLKRILEEEAAAEAAELAALQAKLEEDAKAKAKPKRKVKKKAKKGDE
jgi:hypothetical protein